MTDHFDAVEAFRLMLTSRAIDDACTRVLAEGSPVPNYHSARGQEALVALGMVLDGPDYLQFNYRDFAPLLAKGLTLDALVGDLRLKANGSTAGFGGIMHVAQADLGIVGRNSIFGSRFGIAIGLALSAQLEGAGARRDVPLRRGRGRERARSTRRSTSPACARCRSSSSLRTTASASARGRPSSTPAAT